MCFTIQCIETISAIPLLLCINLGYLCLCLVILQREEKRLLAARMEDAKEKKAQKDKDGKQKEAKKAEVTADIVGGGSGEIKEDNKKQTKENTGVGKIAKQVKGVKG